MPPAIPVVVVAHQSPPLGGPGVRRVASWMRAWPRSGLDPVLLTAPVDDGARFHGYPRVPGSDAALLGREVLRVATPPPGGLAGLLGRLHVPSRVAWTLRHRRMREPEVPWHGPAVAAGTEAGRRRGARAVVSTSQPYEAHAVGREIARRLGVPWVADFRDPMSEAEGRWWPTRLSWWCERREERRWFRDARLVWATSESAAARWRVRFPESAAKVLVRRNGVGPVDFASLRDPPPVPPLRIGHVGRFTDRVGASRLRRLDFRPGRLAGTGSSPEPLFGALRRFLEETPDARGEVVWVTVGNEGPGRPPDGVVAEPHGALDNESALRTAASCHALYLPLTTPPPYGSLIVPQKVYEYMALGRPVLVSGSRREATDLLGPLALVAGDGGEGALARHLEALWRGSLPLGRRPADAPRQDDVAALCASDLRRVVESAAGA